MNAKLIATIVILVMNFKICQSKRYDGFSLFSVIPEEVEQLKFLQNLEKQKYIDMVFWKKPLKLYHEVQFIVSPADTNLLVERSRHFKMKTNLILPNLQKAFDDQLVRRYLRLRVETYSWEYYHTLEDIYQWLTDLALKYHDGVDLISIGNSSEGRDILALVIKNGVGKKQVLVEGGIHGSEWISVEFVTYLAHQLIYNNTTDHHLAVLAKNFNWFLIPVLNPDGFDYNQKVDRLFRKNRSNFTDGVGVDLNRNFDYSFRKFATSTYADDEDYGGPNAFSEPETKSLKDFIEKKLNHLYAYVAIHSYGQKIVIPYGDRINHVEDYAEMANYGKQAIVKMYKLYSRKYSVGTFYDTMGLRISGNSASWVKRNFQVDRVFSLLMRDNGSYGYALPHDQIIPACKEAMVGMLEVLTTRPRYLRADPFSSSRRGQEFEGVFIFWMLFVSMMLK
ncbi:unnamed protein product [Chilo suppressalis]|uniref:Peptidase M14 domain-containing protein n=1 Tax=Chilo suppressalis TaxID=168631 RepID=A0ABN8AWM7_CHISP|nr:unnamed protein product [Chilo suppressalis]